MTPEELAKKAIRDLEQEEAERARLRGTGFVPETARRWWSLTRFWYQFVASMTVFWQRFIYPFYSWAYWLFKLFFWQHFRRVWDRTVYSVNAAGERKFSKIRGAVVIAATGVFLLVVYNLMFLVSHTALYFATGTTDEIVYLSNAQEIDPENNIHSVQGCVARAASETFSCGEADSLYFRIEPTGFAHIWSVLNSEDHGIFYPDYVAAPIAPGWQQCTVTSYGVRIKFFIRKWDIYPYLLSARCGAIPGTSG
jgi:hypothetical protein